MNDGILVSVIIPAFNAEEHLSETLQSVLNQSHQNLDVIVVDSGSTDQTSSIVHNITDPRLRFFHTENNGAAAARNYGISMATGDYFQFLDADDLLHLQKIENQLNLMLESKANITYTFWEDFRDDNRTAFPFLYYRIDHSIINTGQMLIRSFGMDNWYIPVFSWLTHRKLIEEAGEWNETLSNNDDGEYFYRVLYGAERTACYENVLGYYRRGEANSLSAFNSMEKAESAFKSVRLIEDHIAENGSIELLPFPKRHYYIQYRMFKRQYPELAKRSARRFDKIESDCYLSRKTKFWWCIQNFGLDKGAKLYSHYLRIVNLYRKVS